MRNASLKIILSYIGIYLCLPLLGFVIFGDAFMARFIPIEGNLNLLISLAILISLIFFIGIFYISLTIPDISIPYIHLIYSRRVILPLSFLFVGVGISFYSVAGFEFRQSNNSFSSLGYIGFLNILLKMYFTYAIFLLSNLKSEPSDYIIFTLILIGFFLNLTTSIEVLAIVLCLVGFFNIKSNISKIPVKSNKILPMVITSISVLLVLYVGVVNKMSFGDWLSEESGSILFYFAERFSIHFYSLLHIINSIDVWSFEKIFTAISYEIEVMSYRLSVLFGNPESKPLLESMSRLNVTQIVADPRISQGASPGPVSMFLISPPLMVGSLINILLSGFILKRSSLLIQYNNTLLISLLSMLTVQNIWDGYFSFFSMISEPVFLLFFLIASSERLKKSRE